MVNLDASVTPSTRWQWTSTTDTFAAGTIDSSGTLIVATGTTVYGLDPAGGSTRWRLESPAGCVRDVTLTSTAGLVVIQCDNSFFGAHD
jgi:outer membrane protein assembly factor BamB